MNFRTPSHDILAGSKVTFRIGNKVKNSKVFLILIDAYSYRKMRLYMNKRLLNNTLTLPFNEAGKYYYYFEFESEDGTKQYDTKGLDDQSVIHPFELIVYKENYLTLQTMYEHLQTLSI